MDGQGHEFGHRITDSDLFKVPTQDSGTGSDSGLSETIEHRFGLGQESDTLLHRSLVTCQFISCRIFKLKILILNRKPNLYILECIIYRENKKGDYDWPSSTENWISHCHWHIQHSELILRKPEILSDLEYSFIKFYATAE